MGTRSATRPERDPLRLLHVEDAAKVLGVDTAFLKELREAGEVGAVKRGREWRVPYRALELWVERIAQGALPRPADAAPRRRGRPPMHRLLG